MVRNMLLFALLAIFISPLLAQPKETPSLEKYLWKDPAQSTSKGDKPAIDFEAIDHWIRLGNDQDLAITPDGKYFAYTIKNQPFQSSTLVVQATVGSWQQPFAGASPGFFSGDSKHYIFQNKEELCSLPADSIEPQCIKEVATFRQPNNGKHEWLAYQLKNSSSLVLKNLFTGKEKHFENVANYSFDNAGEWLACQLSNENKELVIYHLPTGMEQRFSSVSSFLFNNEGNALTIISENLTSNGPHTNLQYVSLPEGAAVSIWSTTDKKNTVISQSFDASGKQLVFIVQAGNNSSPDNSIWYYKAGMDKAMIRINNQAPEIADGFFIQNAFFPDEKGYYIMINLQQRFDVHQQGLEAVKVDVWSHSDTIIQSVQSHQLGIPKIYRSVMQTEGGPLIRLENEYEKLKTLKGNFAVLAKMGKEMHGDRFWEKGYHTDTNWIVSLKDGSRTLLKTLGDETLTTFWFSPEGHYLVYFDLEQQCHYFSYNLLTRKFMKISEGIPAWQLGALGDFLRPNKPEESAGIAGWLQGDKGLLVYDNYDLWELDLDGKKLPANITGGYGRLHQVQLRLAGGGVFGDLAPVIGPNETLLLKATSRVTKHNGFYSKVLGSPGNPELLYMGPCVLEMAIPSGYDPGMKPLKAANSNTWILKRQTDTEAPNYFLTSDFKQYKSLTNLQPQQHYNWLRSELHSFKQLDGTLSHGILYKPENFDPTKKYPLIIGFYEQYSERLYQFIEPEYLKSPIIRTPWLVSHGYLVFTPDIYFTRGKKGQSTLNTVEGAVRYLRTLPFVNGNALAACGHSYSGTPAYYVLTHSNSFAAMSIGAGATNLISDGLSLVAGGWENSRLNYYNYDTYMGHIWQNKKGWLAESPIMYADKVTSPVLIFHCKKDWSPVQGALQMFIALRRLEKKVWWLQYDEGSHVLTELRDIKDFTIRSTQFYDHYLKRAPAPYWMTIGIPNQLRGIESRYELDSEGICGKNCPVCLKVVNSQINK